MKASHVLVAALSVASTAVAGPAAESHFSVACGGFAPLQVSCQSEPFYFGDSVFRLEVDIPDCVVEAAVAGKCYVGDVRMVLDFSSIDFERRCSVIAVAALPPDIFCRNSGTINVFARTRLACHSDFYAMSDYPPGYAGVVPGVGAWGCRYSR